MIEIHVPIREESTIRSTQVTHIPPSLEEKEDFSRYHFFFFSKGAQLS
jgi:hypothetical protein